MDFVWELKIESWIKYIEENLLRINLNLVVILKLYNMIYIMIVFV